MPYAVVIKVAKSNSAHVGRVNRFAPIQMANFKPDFVQIERGLKLQLRVMGLA